MPFIRKVDGTESALLAPHAGSEIQLPDGVVEAAIWHTFMHGRAKAPATAFGVSERGRNWAGAVELFGNYGHMTLKTNGETIGKEAVTTDGSNVPLALKFWVIYAVNEYFAPFLDQKNFIGASESSLGRASTRPLGL